MNRISRLKYKITGRYCHARTSLYRSYSSGPEIGRKITDHAPKPWMEYQPFRAGAQAKIQARTKYTAEELDAAFNSLLNPEPSSQQIHVPKLLSKIDNFTKLEKVENKEMIDRMIRKLVILPKSKIKSLEIPDLVRKRVVDHDPHAFEVVSGSYDWERVLTVLFELPLVFEDLEIEDIKLFVSNIPVESRAKHAQNLIALVNKSQHSMDLQLYNLIMESYAHTCRSDCFELCAEMLAAGIEPDEITYQHILQLFFRQENYDQLSATVSHMLNNKIELNLNHYEIVLQSCLQLERYDELLQIFQFMKFRSLQTQPNAKIFSIMIMAAGMKRNVEQAINLYEEMTTRPIDPIKTTPETLQSLIFACARRFDYQARAWELAVEYHERNFPISREFYNTLLHLCGESGDIKIARSIITQMTVNSAMMSPDIFSFQNLMKAYAIAGAKRRIHAPPLAPLQGTQLAKINTLFLHNQLSQPANFEAGLVPFLPTIDILGKEEIQSESRAIMTFLQTKAPDLISRVLVYNFLKMAINGNFKSEFRIRFAETTVPAVDPNVSGVPDAAYIGWASQQRKNPVRTFLPSSNNTANSTDATDTTDTTKLSARTDTVKRHLLRASDSRLTTKVFRDLHIYQLALDAAYKSLTPVNRDTTFIEAVFRERQAYIASQSAADYTRLSERSKILSDKFATIKLINGYARAEAFEQAAAILQETCHDLEFEFKDLLILHTKAKQTGNLAICDLVRQAAAIGAASDRRRLDFEAKLNLITDL
ncbi:uncharacterized protein V1516DRAFT_669448 [Lipomyces oligophaga]|uniref:uncharacterized protein n=1 Tax=Lipomyces oligophaga TaxID=45792 RepID=UPI0034CD0B18